MHLGYSCATIYKDTLNLGNTESGRDVYPCVHFQSEVSELWSFDVSTYQWVFLNTSKWQTHQLPPPAREQHSAAVIGRDIFIYGGKTRIFLKDAEGNALFTHHADVVHGDLWRLYVERAKQYLLTYPNTTHRSPISSSVIGSNVVNETIPQNGRLFATVYGNANNSIEHTSDGVNPRQGLCIDKAIVRVSKYYNNPHVQILIFLFCFTSILCLKCLLCNT